jgi:serine/threonine-protein kinase HipA
MLNGRSKIVNREYIIKFSPDEAPFAVENEAFFLGLAKKCNIPTATYKVLTDSLGNHALSLERFDRIPTDIGNLRQAQEDGCQVMNLYPADKYDPNFVDLAEKLISLCPAKEIAGYNLFKQLVFSWLIGNGDAHAKNFSILESPSGEWMISPAYDLLCTAYYQNDKEMALSIEGLTTKWTRELMLRTAKRLYVPERAANSVIDKQLKVLASLSDDIVNRALPFPSHLNHDVAKLLKKRFSSITE